MENEKLKCPECRDTNIEIFEDDPHYDKVFRCHDSTLTRRDLEELPAPFCTKNITDDQMETIIAETDAGTRQRLKIYFDSPIDFENSRHREVWWEELEAAVKAHNVPYLEDLPNESEG